MARIQEGLETHYTYSLTYTRTGTEDPILEFLTENPLGHCEYFASSLALLVRAAGVPARVVTGLVEDELLANDEFTFSDW